MTDNELIGKFMGHSKSNWSNDYGYYDDDGFRHYQYADDWNVLMSVLEKIESLDDVDFIVITRRYMNINRKVSITEETINNPSKIMSTGKTYLETVYSGVVEYIKLYNQQS